MKKIILAFNAGILLSIASCKKQEGPQGPQGSQGPALSGTLVGYVDAYDSYGNLQKTDSISITITGKPNTAFTDTLGKFSLKNLTTGIYELNVSKQNYQSTKIPSLNFIGGGTQYLTNRINITQAPNYTILNLSFTSSSVSVTYTVTANASDTKPRKVIIFMNKNSNVSFNPSNYESYLVANIPANSSTATGTIPGSVFSQGGFVSSSTIYAIAYPISNANNASTYFDVNTGKTIFNNINISGASNTNSYIVP